MIVGSVPLLRVDRSARIRGVSGAPSRQCKAGSVTVHSAVGTLKLLDQDRLRTLPVAWLASSRVEEPKASWPVFHVQPRFSKPFQNFVTSVAVKSAIVVY